MVSIWKLFVILEFEAHSQLLYRPTNVALVIHCVMRSF